MVTSIRLNPLIDKAAKFPYRHRRHRLLFPHHVVNLAVQRLQELRTMTVERSCTSFCAAPTTPGNTPAATANVPRFPS